MNVDAKPFVPCSDLGATSRKKTGNHDQNKKQGHRQDGSKKDQTQEHHQGGQRRRHRRQRHASCQEEMSPSSRAPNNDESSGVKNDPLVQDADLGEASPAAPKSTESNNLQQRVKPTNHHNGKPPPSKINATKLTKHRNQQKQKQMRRRKRKPKKDNGSHTNGSISPENSPPLVASASENDCFELNQHKSQQVQNLRASQEGIDLNMSKGSFPNLKVVSTNSALMSNKLGIDTSWSNCLASKIASSELEQLQQEQRKVLEERTSLAYTSPSAVELTMLTSRSSSQHCKIEDDENAKLVDAKDPESATVSGEEDPVHSADSSTAIPPHTQPQLKENGPNNNNIPKTKLKWTGSEISKMRHRWWEAVRAKRKQAQEDKKQKALVKPKIALKWAEGGAGTADDDGLHNADDSSFSSSDSDTDDESHGENAVKYHDPMQPPSLSTPFDELDLTSPGQLLEPPKMSQSLLDLEQFCIQSSQPLHAAISNHALTHVHHEALHYKNCNGDSCDKISSQEDEESDGECVLRRLLSMQSPDDIIKWKCERVSLAEMRRLEAANTHHQELRVGTLTDNDTAGLVSADTTSLTPLQLAVYWNLPRIIRILCTTVVLSSSKHTMEEDEHGRTPLMLACELGHVACIQTLLRVSSLRKLDRRERIEFHNAFHFACMGRSLVDGDAEFDHVNTPACAESIDMLLRYAPLGVQKRVLVHTNSRGQNLLHLACCRGDLQLLERLLDLQWTVSKALDAKDSFGYTPFLAAVAANSTDIIMHLLTTRFATGPNYSSWFSGCPLIVAVSKQSISMVTLLLETGYGASVSYHATTKNYPGNSGMRAHDEVNRALLEIIYQMAEDEKNSEKSDDAYEIIHLLINQGGANPHLSVLIQFSENHHTQGSRAFLEEDVPLSAAARFADVEAVCCMINAYSSYLERLKKQRRNDPLLLSQPESYFEKLEGKEDETADWSIDTAIVVSLFMLWQTAQNKHGKCALALYRHLSCNAVPRNLSQRAIEWLSECLQKCILISARKRSIEGYHFLAPLIQYNIPSRKRCKPVDSPQLPPPYQDVGANFMDWSYALTDLPWFISQAKRVNFNCRWIEQNISGSSDTKKVNRIRSIAEDEFYLVVEGQQLLAHKSVVSAKSGKLAAHIHFTETHAQESLLGDSPLRLSVKVDHLPLLVAKMFLSHCYHGSITFGLRESPIKQCHQLLEMAMLAEEYLCPSLLLECELRLLLQSSICICPHCSGDIVLSKEETNCPIGLELLKKAQTSHDNDGPSLYCEPVGVLNYKTPTYSMLSKNGGLITPESALDILAVAQQLEQSSSCQQGLIRVKFRSQSQPANDPNSAYGGGPKVADKDTSAGCIPPPFAAAKMKAVWVILRNFREVIRSDSYLRQINSAKGEGDDMTEVDASLTTGAHAGYNEHAISFLQICLDELSRM